MHKKIIFITDSLPLALGTNYSNCSNGDVRLVGSVDGDQGRLEVCVNSAWGTVCSNAFGASDAAVACEAIEGYNSTGKRHFITKVGKCRRKNDSFCIVFIFKLIIIYHSSVPLFSFVFCLSFPLPLPGLTILSSGYFVGSGPIFLDQLACSGTEQSLLSCSSGRPVGLHQCNHTMDIGLKCQGKNSSLRLFIRLS